MVLIGNIPLISVRPSLVRLEDDGRFSGPGSSDDFSFFFHRASRPFPGAFPYRAPPRTQRSPISPRGPVRSALPPEGAPSSRRIVFLASISPLRHPTSPRAFPFAFKKDVGSFVEGSFFFSPHRSQPSVFLPNVTVWRRRTLA